MYTTNFDYKCYVYRCKRIKVPPVSRDEFARRVKAMKSVVHPIPGYERYLERCRVCDIEPLSYLDYMKQLPRLPRPAVCPDCNYNLTGNISGRCPECGAYLY